MENKVQEFLNEQFGEVRVSKINNELWFIAKDICDILGTQTKDLRKILNNKGIDTIDILTNGGIQKLLCVSEPSLYKIIFKSRKSFAEEFQDWICGIVIPSIRKDGAYINNEEKLATGELDEATFLLKAFNILQDKANRYEKENKILKPKASKWDKFLRSDNTYSFTDVAKLVSTMADSENKEVNISVIKLTEFLRNEGILSKSKTQDKEDKKGTYKNLPNKDYEQYFNVVSVDTGKFNKVQTRVKSEGVEYIYDLLVEKLSNAS